MKKIKNYEDISEAFFTVKAFNNHSHEIWMDMIVKFDGDDMVGKIGLHDAGGAVIDICEWETLEDVEKFCEDAKRTADEYRQEVAEIDYDWWERQAQIRDMNRM